jgi:hypothetical protein
LKLAIIPDTADAVCLLIAILISSQLRLLPAVSPSRPFIGVGGYGPEKPWDETTQMLFSTRAVRAKVVQLLTEATNGAVAIPNSPTVTIQVVAYRTQVVRSKL